MNEESDISLTIPNSINEESNLKSRENQGLEFDESRPLTFYVPSCHCLEEKMKEQEAMRLKMEQRREKEINEVLSPDHPALEKFQRALKEHLIKQIERLDEEITNLETETKKKNEEKETLGIEAYETQQMVCKKQKMLEEFIGNVKTASAAREEIEIELREYKEKYKRGMEEFMNIRKEETEQRNEIETINLLLHQASNWEKEVESDITISKRMTEKTVKDQMQLLKEKRKQDMILYKLQSEVWKLETDLENTDMKLEMKEREREDLAQAVAEGNTTIEALEADYRCLMHSWNSVVVAISNRDRVLHCVNQELKLCSDDGKGPKHVDTIRIDRVQNILEYDHPFPPIVEASRMNFREFYSYRKYGEDYKNILCETEKIKKLTKEEMTNNERLTAIKQRILSDIASCRNKIDEELAKYKKIEKKIMKYQSIIELTEKDIAGIEAENRDVQTTLTALDRDLDKKNQRKLDWEEKIFILLEDETTNSKASQHLAIQLRQIKGQNRKLEIALSLNENKVAVIQTKLESQVAINSQLSKLVQDLDLNKKHLEKELNDFQEKLKEYDNLIMRRQRLTDQLNIKVMEMIASIGGKDISLADLRMKTLEKKIEEAKEKIKELQTFWMREQRNVLNLSETRQQQIANNDLLRKQILILQQKNLKVGDEIEAILKQDMRTSRNITNYHNQIAMKCESLSRKKDEKRGLDAHNDLAQMQFMAKLKDAEIECLRFEAHIADIEEEKLILSKQLLDINREALEWEKRLKIIIDTKNQMKVEKGSEGEIGQMEVEVHKMEVRYSQLRKAQERLMTDLEQCVYRRESIVAGNEAKEKRSKFGADKIRFNFKRKLDDMRNRIKQVENGINTLENQIKKLQTEKATCENEMERMKNEVSGIKKITENIIEEYENMKSDKQMQFEVLIMKQKKLNMFSDLARGKKPFLMNKNECALTQKLMKNEENNSKLIIILDNLLRKFPNYIHYFSRIVNTLNLPRVYSGDINTWTIGTEEDCLSN